MSSFQKGDTVRLKSGGPLMTVIHLGDYSTMGTGPKDGVKCQWFEGTRPLEKVFDSAALEISDDRPRVGRVTRG